jgi:hypothetical protein
VFAGPALTNRDYEGEIAQAGDTVHILRPGAGGAIKTYVPNVNMDPPERPDGDDLTLVVDQYKYFNIAIDDVNRVQTLPGLFDAWARRTARNARVVIDSFVAGRMQAGVLPANTLGSDAAPVTVKADGTGQYTPYQLFVELRRLMNAQDAPEEQRWAVIDEDLEAEVLQDDKYIPAGAAETRSGQIGRIAGFTIYRTTAVPSSPGSGTTPVANSKILAGSGNDAVTFASQLAQIKPYEIEQQFGDGLKGLELYGAKVLEPETIALAHVAS